MNGKNLYLKIISIILTFLLFHVASLFPQEKTENLQSVTLEDFELDESGKPKRTWFAIPNRFGKEKNLDSGASLQELAWVEAWPEAYFGKEGVFDDGNEKRDYKTSLALKTAFNQQGYNFVELYPLAEQDGKYVKSPIPFKGRVKQIDLWIWGSNYNYDVEFVLSDFRGVEHRLPVGNIKHIGWKNFVVTIPSYIPQSVSYIPSLKSLKLVKIVVWTNPNEKVTGAYIYFDHIKYLADLMESKYDGYNLGETDVIENLWEKGPKAPSIDEVTQ